MAHTKEVRFALQNAFANHEEAIYDRDMQYAAFVQNDIDAAIDQCKALLGPMPDYEPFPLDYDPTIKRPLW